LVDHGIIQVITTLATGPVGRKPQQVIFKFSIKQGDGPVLIIPAVDLFSEIIQVCT